VSDDKSLLILHKAEVSLFLRSQTADKE
jgi:hypothetical protein